MGTIFDNLGANVDLSIFKKDNDDPKTPVRRHYLSLVGLLQYVDIINGDLTGQELPEGVTEDTVKGMVYHCIGDIDTRNAMLGEGPEPTPVEDEEALDNAIEEGGRIEIQNNMNITQEVDVTKEVEIDLGGNTLSGAQMFNVVEGGKLTIKNGTIESTDTPVKVTSGNVNIEESTITSSSFVVYADGGNVNVTNCEFSSNTDIIVARNRAKVVVDGENTIINSGRSNGISAVESEVIFNNGNLSSQEAGLLGFKDSTITINGGTIEGRDNGPIMGNGTAAGKPNDGTNAKFIMNGGKLIAHIQSSGYIACGVYVPNSGSFIMNGGEIVSDGCGICMRAGDVQLLGGTITANGETGVKGKVGDSRVVVGPYAIVYDQESKYPGAVIEPFHLTIGKNMTLTGTDGDVDFVFESAMDQEAQEAYKTEHFTDSRE